MSPPPPPEQSGRTTEILGLARQTLLDDGIDGFVMRQIADQAGMRVGNLQYYFATRDDLLEAILVAESTVDFTVLSAAADLGVLIDALLDRFGSHKPTVYSLVGVLAVHNRRLAAVWAEIHERIYGLVSGLIQSTEASVTPSDARVRSVLVMALIEGASTQLYRSAGATSAKAMRSRIVSAALSVAKST